MSDLSFDIVELPRPNWRTLESVVTELYIGLNEYLERGKLGNLPASSDWDSLDYVRASQLANCPKFVANNANRELSEDAEKRIVKGVEIHSAIGQGLLYRKKELENYGVFQVEARIRDDIRSIAATVDVLWRFGMFNVPIEVKTTQRSISSPFQGHLYQAAMQMELTGAMLGGLWYLRLRNDEIVETRLYYIERDGEIFRVYSDGHLYYPVQSYPPHSFSAHALWARVDDIRKYQAEPNAPPPFEGPNYLCEGCSLYQLCWRSNDESV